MTTTMPEQEIVHCKWCGDTTRMTGTQECDPCNNLNRCIAYNPQAARKILRSYQPEGLEMDPYSPPGTKVVWNGRTASYPGDNKNHIWLAKDVVYIVTKTEVHDAYTDVWLEGAGGRVFNSVWFDLVGTCKL